ncbi:hypothetical protein [Streptomyces griseolus]|uniref:hypothetical protein n=1 Tax=Streptomyces griseolus TaxID=1909 RepID=UPI002243B3FF|nr:hypothetical protein [Streptomyces griseolus]
MPRKEAHRGQKECEAGRGRRSGRCASRCGAKSTDNRRQPIGQSNWRSRRDELCGRVDTQTEALFAVTHAHALAKADHRPEAVREIERARTVLSSAKGDDVPFWALSWGPTAATVHSRSAKVFETLGDRRRAAAMYGAAASRPPGTYARIVALDLVAQAEMQAAEGSIEQACATWGKAIDHMHGVQSGRTRKAVGSMRRDLSRFRTRGLRCVAALDERAREFLSSSR